MVDGIIIDIFAKNTRMKKTINFMTLCLLTLGVNVYAQEGETTIPATKIVESEAVEKISETAGEATHTTTTSIQDQTQHLKNQAELDKLKEKNFKAEQKRLKAEQRLVEKKEKAALKDQKRIEKENKKALKQQNALIKNQKKLDKAKSKLYKAEDKYNKENLKFERNLGRGNYSPIKELKAREKLLKLSNTKKQLELEVNKLELKQKSL